MTFNRVVLVGSVLPEDFDWETIFRRAQVQSLRVDGSCYDWPVGWLCAALRSLGQKTIGTGGFVGFTGLAASRSKREFFWYMGDHGAPLHESNLPALANFAVTGQIDEPLGLRHVSVKWFAVVSNFLRRYSILPALVLICGWLWLAYFHLFAAVVVLGLIVLLVIVLDVI